MSAQIHPLEKTGAETGRSTSGDDGGFDTRLRNVEIRLATIEEQMKHVATKAWLLGVALFLLISLPAALYFVLQSLLVLVK